MPQAEHVLSNAIRVIEREYESALDRVLSAVEDNDDAYEAARSLREAIEMVRCLRRLVPSCSVQDIHKAFGAPGDFGYETPIGSALAAFYGVR